MKSKKVGCEKIYDCAGIFYKISYGEFGDMYANLAILATR